MKRLHINLILGALVIFTAVISCNNSTVYSAENEYLLSSEAEYDGYIVSVEVDPYIARLAEDSGESPEPLVKDKNLYYAKDETEIERLCEMGEVKYVEPNYIAKLADVDISAEYTEDGLWGHKIIGADVSLKNGYLGEGVRVGVIDSGLNKEHIEFAGTANEGYDYYYMDESFDDVLGHGTFVSGIIASRLNGTGMVGIAPEVELVTLKAFSGEEAYVSTIVQAIYGGVDDFNCDVLNVSFDFDVNPQSLQNAIDYATSKGVLVAAAVGNGGDTSLRYPAGYDNVIGVGSVTSEKKVYLGSVKNESVFVVAPGLWVKSLDYTGNDKYRIHTGTSFATPHVTALLALLKSIDKNIDIEYAKEVLMNTSEDISDAGYDINSGYGIININSALDYMLKSKPAYQNRIYMQQSGNTLKFNINAICRAEEDAKLWIVLKDSNGVLKDTVVYDATGCEFENFEYSIDASNLLPGVYSVEAFLMGDETISPLTDKNVYTFEWK